MKLLRSFTVLSVAACVLAVTPLAWANHIDSMYKTANLNYNCSDGGGFCQTDNSTLRWFDEASITFTGRTNIDSTLENTFEPTDLSVSIQDPPSYSGSSETDIIYRQVTLPPGVLGQTWCEDSVSSTQCDQHYIDFAASTPDTKTICHESGHGVGLTHGANASPSVSNGDDTLGCMQTPFSEITSATLGSHNAALINSTY